MVLFQINIEIKNILTKKQHLICYPHECFKIVSFKLTIRHVIKKCTIIWSTSSSCWFARGYPINLLRKAFKREKTKMKRANRHRKKQQNNWKKKQQNFYWNMVSKATTEYLQHWTHCSNLKSLMNIFHFNELNENKVYYHKTIQHKLSLLQYSYLLYLIQEILKI